MNFTLGQGAQVELVNNTVLQGSYDYDTLYLATDEDCAFTLSGTGSIRLPDTVTTWDIDCSRNMHMTIGMSALSDNDQDAVSKIIGMLDDVKLDKAQFTGAEPQLYVWYGRYAESLEGFDMQLHETAVNQLSIGASALQMQVCAETDDGAATLKSMVYPCGDGQTLCFGELVNHLQESWWLQSEADLYIPYPEGVGQAAAEYYRFWIDYPSLFGEKKSLTSDDGIEYMPYGLKITVRELLPFVLNWEEIRDPGEVTWQEVVSVQDLSQKAPSLKVIKENGRFVIDGGNVSTISDVRIDCMDPQSTMGNGTYIFRNVKLKRDVELISVSGNALGLQLESSVVMNGGVRLEADACGDITAHIACNTRSIPLLIARGSVVRLQNTGTTGNISMECCDHSRAEIINHSPLSSPVFQLDDHCTADITLNGDIGYLISWLWGESQATYTSNGDAIHMMNLEANSGSRLTFINNSTITNNPPDEYWDGNEWGDYQLKLAVDEESELVFGGSGSIMPGTQMYDYYTSNFIGPKNGASVVFDVIMPDVSSDHEQNRTDALEIAKNILFDWKQVKKHPGAQKVIAVRRDEEQKPEYTYVIDLKEPRALRLPSRLERIENSAFAGVEALEWVVVPESVSFIGDEAFADRPGVVLVVPEGSYAQQHARDHGIRHTGYEMLP